MADVFISYSRADKEFVRRLHETLKAQGREAWVDWEGIPPTAEFLQEIYGAIEGAHTFIFALSPDSVGSTVCNQEIAHAALHNKRMVPLVVREVAAAKVPEPLAKINWIFFRESDDFNQSAETLFKSLDTDLDWVRFHTRLLTRAIEWDVKGKNDSYALRGIDLRAAEQWLVQAAAEKERQPTALQAEYILASRKAATRRQRIVLSSVAFGAVVAVVLAIAAWFQRKEADKQKGIAQTSEAKAVEQEKLAVENGKKATRTAVQADFDAALLYREKSESVDPRSLAHLARALRTDPTASLPRFYITSLLRDAGWHVPQTAPLANVESVSTASFSADGQLVVAGCLDGKARIWRLETATLACPPLPHLGGELPPSFSSDGQHILTCSEEKTAQVWDVKTGEALGSPLRHDGSIKAFSFSRDGRRVVTASEDGSARVWDATTGKSIGKPMKHDGSVLLADFSLDGRQVITAAMDKTVRTWDAESGQLIGSPRKLKDMFAHAQLSADRRKILTYSNETSAEVWGLTSGQRLGKPIRVGFFEDATLSPNGQQLATYTAAEGDTEVSRLWDVEGGFPLGKPLLRSSAVSAVHFSADGRYVVTAGSDKTARIWEVNTSKRQGEPMPHGDSVTSATFSPDGRTVLTASGSELLLWESHPSFSKRHAIRDAVAFSADGARLLTASKESARVWDTETGKPLSEPISIESGLQDASLSPDGQQIVLRAENRLQVWSVPASRVVGPPVISESVFVDASFAPAGRRILATCEDYTVRIWDSDTGAPQGEPMRHEEKVSRTFFSEDGRRVVTFAGGKARVWDAENGKPIGGPMEENSSHLFSHDALRVLQTHSYKAVQVCDVVNGKPIGQPMVHNDRVEACCFSPDGRCVATASYDKTARLWDAETGQPICAPLRHDDAVQGLVFSADGQRLLTFTAKDAQVWVVPTGQAVGKRLHMDELSHVQFSPDRRWIITSNTRFRLWDAESGQPLCEPLSPDDETSIRKLVSIAHGRRIGTLSNDGVAYIWDVAVDLDSPLPPWVPQLAESLAAGRFNEGGLLVPPEKEFVDLRAEVLALKSDDLWSRLGRWFFTRGPERSLGPDLLTTVAEFEQLHPVESP